MDHIESFADERLVAHCVHCGGLTETRDHCPSRVLLDKPHPENLPYLPACAPCNSGFSRDEEYFASLVECSRTGSVEAVIRPKIRQIFEHSPALATRLSQARNVTDSGITWFAIEEERVRKVVLKLARGHAAFELSEPQCEEPSSIRFAPLHSLPDSARQAFEGDLAAGPSGWPEVGSRAMQRMVIAQSSVFGPEWIDVQTGQYRYLAIADGAVVIRIVVSEYLACEVTWDDAIP